MASRYLEEALKDMVSSELRRMGFKATAYIDIKEIHHIGGIGHYHVLVKHRMANNGHDYNCSAFSVLSYSDWTVSQAELIGRAELSQGQFFMPQVVSDYISLTDFAEWLGFIGRMLRGDDDSENQDIIRCPECNSPMVLNATRFALFKCPNCQKHYDSDIKEVAE